MRILRSVAGGITAYKAVLLLRLLREQGHAVRVVPGAGLEFVGARTLEALSGQPVTTDVFDDVTGVQHVALGQRADLVIVAPATADFLATCRDGLADDLLTTTLLAARCPVAAGPGDARRDVETAPRRGATWPRCGAGRARHPPRRRTPDRSDTGPGRLPDPEEVAAAALLPGRSFFVQGQTRPERQTLPGPRDLNGKRVVMSAGDTRSPLDPVWFIGNRSWGRQGVAWHGPPPRAART